MRRLLPLAILAALLLGACSPEITLLTRLPASTPTAKATPRPATATPVPSPSVTPGLRLSPELAKGLQVAAWFGGDLPGLEPLTAEFNESNPWGVKVSLVSHSNLSRLAAAVDASLKAGSPPNLVIALPEQLLGWRESLLDLAPYAAHPQFGAAQGDILPVFREQSQAQGVQVGLPVIRSGRYLFYNAGWARELGFEAAPRTWEDFRKQACAANAAWKTDSDPSNDGLGGLALEVTPNWQTPYGWIRALGGQAAAQDAPAFASQANAAALEKLLELRAEGCAWLPSTLTNFEHLAARRALFISGSLSDLTEQRAAFSGAASGDAWTVIAFPGERPVVPVYGLDAAVFRSQAGQELAAWLFLRWLLEPENQVKLARAGGLFPASSAAFDLLKSDYAANPQKGAAAALLADAEAYPQWAQWGLANKVLADGFLYLLRGFPNVSAQAVLEQMDATINDLTK